MISARAVMMKMLDRLHQTHFGIIPAELYNDVAGSHGKGGNTTGIDVRVVGLQALVTSVEAGSSAAHFPGGKEALILGDGNEREQALTTAVRERPGGVSILQALRDFLATRGPFNPEADTQL